MANGKWQIVNSVMMANVSVGGMVLSVLGGFSAILARTCIHWSHQTRVNNALITSTHARKSHNTNKVLTIRFQYKHVYIYIYSFWSFSSSFCSGFSLFHFAPLSHWVLCTELTLSHSDFYGFSVPFQDNNCPKQHTFSLIGFSSFFVLFRFCFFSYNSRRAS